MKEEILKPLTEYIDDIKNSKSFNLVEFTGKIIKRNDFGKLPLSLGQFIPCKDGKPLEKPERYDEFLKWGDFGRLEGYKLQMCKDYRDLEKKVLFKGWELQKEESYDDEFVIHNADEWLIWDIKEECFHTYKTTFSVFETIESISHLNLPLTNQGKEQIL